jgi:hypothetical protein
MLLCYLGDYLRHKMAGFLGANAKRLYIMLTLQGPQPTLPGNRFPVVSHFFAAYRLEIFRSTTGEHGQAIFNSGVLCG